MVSCFVPRGRFLFKSNQLHHSHYKSYHPPQTQGSTWRNFHKIGSKKETANSRLGSTAEGGFIQIQHLSKSPYQRRSAVAKLAIFLLKWTPVSICALGTIEWQFNKWNCIQNDTMHTASRLQSMVYCLLPLRLISRCWGWLASCYIPEPLRPYIYGWYVKVFNVNLEEALYSDLKHYETITEFFTRPLLSHVRPIDANAVLVSPADGKILHFGTASKSLIEQVKGVNYHIQDFLGPVTWTNNNNNNNNSVSPDNYLEAIKYKKHDNTMLYQCVIYLAPGDYHRFHSPADWEPICRRHFPGELLSVNPKIVTWLPGLFCLNERVLYIGEWQYGFFSYTAVGATNVGSVQIFMDENLRTNRWIGLTKKTTFNDFILDPKRYLKKGDLLGKFNMGSTIVLLFEAPANFHFNLHLNQKIRVGEPLGHFV